MQGVCNVPKLIYLRKCLILRSYFTFQNYKELSANHIQLSAIKYSSHLLVNDVTPILQSDLSNSMDITEVSAKQNELRRNPPGGDTSTAHMDESEVILLNNVTKDDASGCVVVDAECFTVNTGNITDELTGSNREVMPEADDNSKGGSPELHVAINDRNMTVGETHNKRLTSNADTTCDICHQQLLTVDNLKAHLKTSHSGKYG